MLFNSFEYIVVFLPVAIVIYFWLNKKRFTDAGKAWLVASSFFFYSFWNPVYLSLIVGSILVNYGLGSALSSYTKGSIMKSNIRPNMILMVGVTLNLVLLGYYKYMDFFIANSNAILNTNFPLIHHALPLAISFFTFQQIAYLVDSSRGECREYNFLNYCLFVTFFPQLISGPIVHHKEMMPQFTFLRNKILNYRNMSIGLYMFALGLFKKVVIADTFAVWVSAGFDQAQELSFFDAWGASISYTFQLYYDFSGYTDMAVGSALFFNIKLPLNFNSPYKARNIQDFWRRWHMTLTRWLRDYLYIPLGGNRKGQAIMYLNLFLTFFIGGFWHGAGWTFILWGIIHGIGSAFHKFWQTKNLHIPSAISWFLTFLFVHFSWVFFRALSFQDAIKVFRGMFAMNGIVLPERWKESAYVLSSLGVNFGNLSIFSANELSRFFIFTIVIGAITFLAPNSMEHKRENIPTFRGAGITVFLLLTSFLFAAYFNKTSEFLYFQF